MPNITKCIIPCAGKGTRMQPISNILCKELLPINLIPAIDYIFDEIVYLGLKEVLIISSKSKKILNNYVKTNLQKKYPNLKIKIVYQRKINGLAKAVYLAKNWCKNETFYYINPDNLFSNLNKINNFLNSFDTKSLLLAFYGDEEQMKKYSVIETQKTKKNLRVKKIMEKPDPKETKSRLFTYWRAIFTSEIFNKIKTLAIGKNNEFQLTDAIQELVKLDQVEAYVLDKGICPFDIGSNSGYIEANNYFYKNEWKK